MMHEHIATLTPTLSLSEGEGAVFDPLAPGGGAVFDPLGPGGGEGQGERERSEGEYKTRSTRS